MSQRTTTIVFLVYICISFVSSILKAETTFLQTSSEAKAGKKEKNTYYSQDPEDYLSAKADRITNINCPLPNIADNANNICFCEKGNANYPFNGVDGVYCKYQQKPQLSSFLVELFLGMGIGHFLIGQNIMGSFKLLLQVIPCIIGGLGLCGIIKTKLSEGTTGLIMSILLYSMSFAWFIWWLTDAIMFGLNKYRDSNEVPLKAW